ncbi:MAG: YkgJ family cysteine cluster protein [Candidatus Heimdallarchaeota archaeon]|nr:YkgJ family cysteine cluster protein [Candidatus Heimdallarchaeota archaeon]
MKKPSDSLEICSKHCGSKCCRSTPPALTKEDIDRIEEKTNIENWYTTIEFNQKTANVVAKKNDTDDCFFLSDNGLCGVYDYRPLDCKLFPLFVQIKKQGEKEYNVRWLVWYCPLTENKGIEVLKVESEKLLISILSENPDQIFDYQEAMYTSRGYKKKHFFKEECLKIQKSDSES